MSISEKLQTIAENEQRVYEAGKAYGETVGKKAQYDEFWDSYQQNGNRGDYTSAFYSLGWNEVTYNPKYPIVAAAGRNADSIFSWSRVVDTKVTVDVSKCTITVNTFNNASYLVTIRKFVVSEITQYSSSFTGCRSLENLTIEGIIGQNGLNFKDSTKLSKASITSVINALSTTTSSLTVTFSKTAVETAFGSTTSQEWLALVATKSNWTISLL